VLFFQFWVIFVQIAQETKHHCLALRALAFFFKNFRIFFFEGGGAHWKISTSSTKAGRMKSGGSSTQTAGC
jgi:hypothetical protein